MRQLLQHLDSGVTSLEQVPAPAPEPGSIVVETRASVVSAGTERMLVEFGRAGLLEKARRKPDRVREVLAKARTDGVVPTVEAVRSRLAEPLPLGYCNAGVVRAVGAGVTELTPGDRVATNGHHAEVVRVPRTLAVRIPGAVSFEAAAFAPLGAIALQGLRNARPTLGETVVVYGLGLVGLLTVQLARVHGLRVIGIDLVDDRLAMAEKLGALALHGAGDVVRRVGSATDGIGADAVLLTLDADSDEPVHLAAEMSRKKGRLVLVGVTGLNLHRADYYEKELSLTVSCSYGPGRYDPVYEEKGHDYPLPYVRWTAQRNFEAFLGLLEDGSVDVEPLVTHRFPFDRATEAYELLVGDRPHLGIVLEYPTGESDGSAQARDPRSVAIRPAEVASDGAVRAGVVGAGGFARKVILPLLRDLGVEPNVIASSSGTSAGVAARRFGAARATTDLDSVFGSDAVDAVFVLTRHDSHAELVCRGLDAGKNVFVEKPLALSEEELESVQRSLAGASGLLTVGFNRRFAPLASELADRLAGRTGPLALTITVNAGRLPDDHWVKDPKVGGGRILAEGCHFVDLARALVGAPIRDFGAACASDSRGRALEDTASITLSFQDGSLATIHYLSDGSRSFPKERVECFFDGTTVVVDNWRRLRSYGSGFRLPRPPRRQDKGHRAELEAWLAACRTGGPPPIPYDELFEVSRVTIEIAHALRGAA